MRIDNKVRGWGDAYAFVSNRLPFAQMDRKIGRILDDFHHWCARIRRDRSHSERARILGVALLQDTPAHTVTPRTSALGNRSRE